MYDRPYLKYLRRPDLIPARLRLALRQRRWAQLHAGPPQLLTVRSTNGLLTIDSRDSVIGQAIYLHRAWETELAAATMAFLRREGLLLPERGVVVDVGANIGMTSIGMLLRGDFERGVAIEPSPENLRLLRRNVSQNGLEERLLILPVAVSSNDGELELELSPENFGDHRIRHSAGAGAYDEGDRRTTRVPVRTLDGCLAEAGVRPLEVGLLWIDVQGHEAQSFQGASELLASGVPVLSEFWPYGIRRSGLADVEYCAILCSRFTDYYHRQQGQFIRADIRALSELFARYPGPHDHTEVVLVHR
jgi:FkbM family methyltransferase